MKFIRSIAAVVVGFIVAMCVNIAIEYLDMRIYPDDIVTDPALLKEKLPTMPMGPLLIVVIAWESGAFVGGMVAALVAGWARCIHAGIIGAAVLTATVANFLGLPGHPNWMVIAGLVLPLPASMLGGWLISPRSESPAPVSNP